MKMEILMKTRIMRTLLLVLTMMVMTEMISISMITGRFISARHTRSFSIGFYFDPLPYFTEFLFYLYRWNGNAGRSLFPRKTVQFVC